MEKIPGRPETLPSAGHTLPILGNQQSEKRGGGDGPRVDLVLASDFTAGTCKIHSGSSWHSMKNHSGGQLPHILGGQSRVEQGGHTRGRFAEIPMVAGRHQPGSQRKVEDGYPQPASQSQEMKGGPRWWGRVGGCVRCVNGSGCGTFQGEAGVHRPCPPLPVFHKVASPPTIER